MKKPNIMQEKTKKMFLRQQAADDLSGYQYKKPIIHNGSL